MTANPLASPAAWLRTSPARGLDWTDAVEPEGGEHGAGLIRNVSVITRGEARGHEVWIDAEMLRQTRDAINDQTTGQKARFTHPNLSGDGLGTFLGRFSNARLAGDTVRADLHFSPTAHDTPDGDLAEYVMLLAKTDPEAFGASIVYTPDRAAEDDHWHHNHRDGEFASPDPDNAANLRHGRIDKLHAVDVVDEPAANPTGLFHRQNIAHEAEALLDYVTGQSAEPPAYQTSLSIHPQRAHDFVARYLAEHGLTIKKGTTPMGKKPKSPSAPTTPAESAAAEIPGTPAEPAAPPAEPATEPAAEIPGTPAEPAPELSTRADLRHFMTTFGDAAGARFYADGLTELEAHRQHLATVTAQLAAYQRALAAGAGEATPVSATPERTSAAPRTTRDMVRIRR